MYNHFRTLLLNLSDVNVPAEHITANYVSKKLPSELYSLYNQLFPVGTSRLYKLGLAQVYLQAIEACNLTSEVITYDNRITYSLNDNSFFKINRLSNPISSDISTPIIVSGSYTKLSSSITPYDAYDITQIDATANVVIYSTANNVYLTPNAQYTTLSSSCYVPLTFNPTTRVSNKINLFDTGLSVMFSGTNASFTASSDREWSFSTEAPYDFDLLGIIAALQKSNAVDAALNFDSQNVNVAYDNLWRLHNNLIYKFAGLLLGYVARVNNV